MKGLSFDIALNRDDQWLVNGAAVAPDVRAYLRDHTAFEIENWGADMCPYCGTPYFRKPLGTKSSAVRNYCMWRKTFRDISGVLNATASCHSVAF
jgi:hypothetical protein